MAIKLFSVTCMALPNKVRVSFQYDNSTQAAAASAATTSGARMLTAERGAHSATPQTAAMKKPMDGR